MDIVNVIFAAVGQILTGAITVITDAFNGVVPLWYTAPNGSGTTGQLTFLGVLSLMAFVFGVLWLSIRFIGKMISLKQA